MLIIYSTTDDGVDRRTGGLEMLDDLRNLVANGELTAAQAA